MAKIQEDSTGKRYVDVPTLKDEHARITFVPSHEAGYKADSIRLQIRDVSGHLRMGPEVPVAALSELVKGIVDLALAAKR